MIRSALVRTLVLVPLLLAGCAASDEPAPRATEPITTSDPFAAAACIRLQQIQANEVNDLHSMDSMSAGSRATKSTDTLMREAGRRLLLAAKDAGELSVYHPERDLEPAKLRVSEAQRLLHVQCTELYGAPPWNFARLSFPPS